MTHNFKPYVADENETRNEWIGTVARKQERRNVSNSPVAIAKRVNFKIQKAFGLRVERRIGKC